MTNEKAMANDHALTEYTKQIVPEFKNTLSIINKFVADPEESANIVNVRKQAGAIRSLYRLVDDYTKALADLKAKIDYCVVETIEKSPEIAKEFKVQAGAKSIKCDATPASMMFLMDKFVEQGYNPSALFAQCSAITAKKAAEAFGLSEVALLESYGDLFATHQNKPSVKML